MVFEPQDALGEDELESIAESESGDGLLDTENPLIKGLLSTKPDKNPGEVADDRYGGDKALGHGHVGTLKFIRGVGYKIGLDGVPAIANFGLAGYHMVQNVTGEGEGEQPTPAEESPAVEAEDQMAPGVMTPEEAMQGSPVG